ncbi:putative iron-regulated protein [Palleronia aestuarii]|uniref:Putative iron-regulated protein n=1 Tax=Palleronia aestuarii TaxID=568105 RepID=A0A2W7NFX9_9RHOB|nr:ChaN family lipoprotein [Palleronia aestuarii]PZX18403.1 putative iron-regulated protein [Palleronia aestuarii]
MRRSTALLLGAILTATSSHAEELAADAVPLDADIVVMGEYHDVPAHHVNQADWVRRMGARAIVFEMLVPGQGDAAEAERLAPAEILGAALDWEARGWPDFAIYDPIFKASGEAELFGAEVSREALGEAVAEGAAAVFPGDAALFGLDEALPEDVRAEREAEQDEAHCGLLPEEMLPGMVEAQRLRDATLAAQALAALDATGGPIAVVTGNGHARRDRGVPAMLALARPDLRVLALGQLTAPDPDAPFDAWVVTADDASGRGDPCDALR